MGRWVDRDRWAKGRPVVTELLCSVWSAADLELWFVLPFPGRILYDNYDWHTPLSVHVVRCGW